MDARKLARFSACASLLACPVCGGPLGRVEAALGCANGHRFDIARQGYVNLLHGGVRAPAYDRASFEARRRVFECGLYAPVADAVSAAVSRAPALPVLDAGCGEGYFTHMLRRVSDLPICAFDISRDSVRMAASLDADDRVMWAVADLSRIPVLDGAAGVVLDIFSPANYREFRRVLAPEGVLVKVVPTAGHLRELRERAAGHLRGRGGYSNERVVHHLDGFCRIVGTERVTSRMALAPGELADLIAMTPLLFGVDAQAVDWTGISEVTVEADLIVARFR